MAILKALKRAIGGDPIREAFDRLKGAQQYHARCVSEEHFHNEMRTFYEIRMAAIDPQRCAADAYRFAEAFEKFEEHQTDVRYWFDRAEQAAASVQARIAQLHNLENGNA